MIYNIMAKDPTTGFKMEENFTHLRIALRAAKAAVESGMVVTIWSNTV